MKCNSCGSKLIKISDLERDEILKYLESNPLKKLEELKNDEPVLVYFRRKDLLFDDGTRDNKIQFRRVENVANGQLKLAGFKNYFDLKNPTIIYSEDLIYTLVPMEKEFLKIIEDGLKNLGDKYSGTKFNNVLKKSWMLKHFMEKYDGWKEKKVIKKDNILEYDDLDFPF